MTKASHTIISGLVLALALFISRAYAPLLNEEPSFALIAQMVAMPIVCAFISKGLIFIVLRSCKQDIEIKSRIARVIFTTLLLSTWMYIIISKKCVSSNNFETHLVYFSATTTIAIILGSVLDRLFRKNKKLKCEEIYSKSVGIVEQGDQNMPVVRDTTTGVSEPEQWCPEESQTKETQHVAHTIEPQTEEIAKETSRDDATAITIEGTTKDKVTLIPRDILFIKSEGNYIDIHFTENGEHKNELIRLNINIIEDILKEYKNIIRCHRSYIVNLNQVEGREGRSNGVTLLLEGGEKVPVSRSYDKGIKKTIKPKSRMTAEDNKK